MCDIAGFRSESGYRTRSWDFSVIVLDAIVDFGFRILGDSQHYKVCTFKFLFCCLGSAFMFYSDIFCF